MPLFPLAALAVILFVLNIFERRLARSRYTQGGRTRSEIKPMRRLFAGRRRRSAVVLQGGCVTCVTWPMVREFPWWGSGRR